MNNDEYEEFLKILDMGAKNGDEWAIRAGVMMDGDEYDRRMESNTMPELCIVRIEKDNNYIYLPYYKGKLRLDGEPI